MPIALLSFSLPWLLALLSVLLFGTITTGFGNTFCQRVLDAMMGAGANPTITIPATWYAALFTTDPTDDDGTSLVEVTGGSYARVAVTNNSTNFPNSTIVSHVATKTTGAAIDWGTATANWGTIVGVGLYDASTSGNLGPWGPLSSSKTVNNGDGFKVTSGNGTFTLS
jgi:hypothetical protein